MLRRKDIHMTSAATEYDWQNERSDAKEIK